MFGFSQNFDIFNQRTNITKNTANAVAGHNIRINALNIGWTDTPGEDVIQKKFHKGGDDWLKKAEKKVPFKRLTKPIDVARAAAFFCSEDFFDYLFMCHRNWITPDKTI